MGIGLWAKLKNGFKRFGKGFKKIYEKVIKPAYNFLKPVLKPAVQGIASAYGGPAAGTAAGLGMEAIDGVINNQWTAAKNNAKGFINSPEIRGKIPGWLKTS